MAAELKKYLEKAQQTGSVDAPPLEQLNVLKGLPNMDKVSLEDLLAATATLEPARDGVLATVLLLEALHRADVAEKRDAVHGALHNVLVARTAVGARRSVLEPSIAAELAVFYGEGSLRGKALQAVLPLLTMINDFEGLGVKVLTGLYTSFLLVCMESKMYAVAKAVLDRGAPGVEPLFGLSVDAKTVLLYYFYAGLCYAALSEYSKASELLSMCYAVPGNAVSTVMVEAHKFNSLVALLDKGTALELPKYVSAGGIRALKEKCSEYDALVQAFVGRNATKVDEVIRTHAQVFAADGTIGLANLVAQAVVARKVQHLTDTFLTLSFDGLAQQAGLPDAASAEAVVAKMIRQGKVYAKIDQRLGMVKFEEADQPTNDAATLANLQQQIASCISLAHQLESVDVGISMRPEFIVQAAQGMHESPDWGPEDVVDLA